MAAKRVDPLKAKAAKQKKIAIVLCVVFAAVLAFQVPKTLKMMKGPEIPTAPVETTAAPETPAPAPSDATAAGAPASAGAPAPAAGEAQPVLYVDTDVPAAATDGQLRSLERFQTKDPFAQQNVVAATSDTPAPAAEAAKPAEAAAAPILTPTGDDVVPPPSGASGASGASGPGTTTTAGTTGTGTATPQAPAAATVTSISVNGVAGDVALEAAFPAGAPVFELVSLAKDGKSVQIGVAGGAYADGSETIKLTLGKPLTLRNTADGSQFVLLLNAVAGFAPSKK